MKKKLTLSLEDETIKQIKIIALENNTTVSEILELITVAITNEKKLLETLKDKYIKE